MSKRTEYLDLICTKVETEIDDLDGIEIDNYIPKPDRFSSWSLVLRKNGMEYELIPHYSLPSDPTTFLPMGKWNFLSVIKSENNIVMQIAMAVDVVNLLLSITQFPFSPVPLLDSTAHTPWLDLKKALGNCVANADAIVKKITSIIQAVQRKNNSLKYELPQIKTIHTSAEAGGSSQTTQTRVPKAAREDLRRASITGGLSSTKKYSSQKTNTEVSGVNSPVGERSTVTDLPTALERGQTADPIKADQIMREFWRKNEDCFVFGRGHTIDVNILQCEDALPSMVVRAKEETGVQIAMSFIMNAPHLDKQTICVMPMHLTRRPAMEELEDIKKGHFYIINGQHSVEASKRLIKDESWTNEDRKEDIKTWRAFVVWSKDHAKLTAISTYLNASNHFKHFNPTWAWNIYHARKVWLTYGRPAWVRKNAVGPRGSWDVSIESFSPPMLNV